MLGNCKTDGQEMNMKTVDQMVYFYNNIFFNKIKEMGVPPENYVIAGGAVRDYLVGEKIKDIDIFTNSKENARKLFDAMLARGGKDLNPDKPLDDRPLYNVVFDSRWFQIVNTVHYNPQSSETIDNFDFTVCCGMISMAGFSCHPNFFQDIVCKHLRVNKLIKPLDSMNRLQKYNKKGYTACSGTILAIAKEVAKINFDNPDENTLVFYPDGSPRFVGVD